MEDKTKTIVVALVLVVVVLTLVSGWMLDKSIKSAIAANTPDELKGGGSLVGFALVNPDAIDSDVSFYLGNDNTKGGVE